MSAIIEFITKLHSEIEQNLTSYGYSANNVRTENVGEYEGTILGWKYIETLEVGRKPTGPNATKGNPTLKDKIEEWITKKGITSADLNTNQLAYVISRHIHKFGNKLYREVQGGKAPQNIFSNVITDERIDDFQTKFAETQILYLQSALVQMFKQED